MAATAKRSRTRRASRPPTPAERVERFFARYLTHWEGRFAGQPFLLEPWQRDDIIAPLFNTLDRRGFRRYREALIGVPRGNGKSPLAAGLALYGLFADNEPGAQCYSLAASKDQAKIVFNTARRMVRASPTLDAMCEVYKDVIEVPETGSIYRALSADAGLAHGLNPHLVTVDELHVHKNPELYEAMQSALHKREQPLLIGITTAGYDRDTLCYRLYQRGIEGRDPRFFFRWWGMPDGASPQDTKAWRKANPATWIRIESLRAQQRAMPLNVWLRLHGNQWTSSDVGWISGADWDANSGEPVIPLGADVSIVVDAAAKKDSTAVVVVYRDPDGLIHWRTWIRHADRMMGYTDFLALEDLIRELCTTYQVKRVAFDPYIMVRTMLSLAGEGIPVEEYPQNDARMVPASQSLYDVILERRGRFGTDAELRAQAMGAVARETRRGWRLDKLAGVKENDAIIAGAIGTHLEEQDARRGGRTMVFTLDDENPDDENPDAEG